MGKGLNSFAVDVAAEEAGIWETVRDMKFLIAKAGNDNWKSLYKKLELQAYGPKNRRKESDRDEEKDFEILMKCLSNTCILDWKGVTLDGKEIPYSKEKCFEILSNPRFRPLAEHLLEISLNTERFMEDMIREDEKK